MKLLVIADSHGEINLLNKIFNDNKNVDIFIHLGDSELPPYLLNNYVCVKGNMDFYEYPLERDLLTPYGIIHLEHGNKYIDKNKLNNYFMFLSGHTHIKRVSKFNNTYIFNPGSLTRPRDSNKGSYLIIDIKSKDEVSYNFVDVDL